MRTLTDSSFHSHSFRVVGALAVSCGVDCLDSEHVVFPGSQAVAHKPDNSTDKGVKSFTITLDFIFQPSFRIEFLFYAKVSRLILELRENRQLIAISSEN